MPLLPPEEIRSLTPLYDKWWGKALIDGARKMFLSSLDRICGNCDMYRGQEFAMEILRTQGCDYEIGGLSVLENLPEGPFITIGNHPYGGVDGLILSDLFAFRRPDYRIMVNKILSLVHNMDPIFISVTPTGENRTAHTKESLQGVKRSLLHIRSGHPLGIFPSGAVSDLHPGKWDISDRPWQESAVRFIQKMAVPVVPVHFLDRNSMYFYLLGLIDWKVRLSRLPKEAVNKKGKRVRVTIGEVIPPEKILSFGTVGELSDFLRGQVYDMPLPERFVRRSTLGYDSVSLESQINI